MNRTLMEKVHCTLSNASLLKLFWTEDVSAAYFLINHLPSTSIDKRTPEKAQSGSHTSYSDMKICGCSAYVHVDTEKLEPRSKKCEFLDYNFNFK